MKTSTIVLTGLVAGIVHASHIDLWSRTQYRGTKFSINGAGTITLSPEVNSYKYVATADDCCVYFYNNGRQTGYRCLTSNQPDSSGPIDKVQIRCS